MSDLCRNRLAQERKSWRKDHPFGFYARPAKLPDGSLDLQNWEAGIPGKAGTPWEGGLYKLVIQFPSDYPAKPPVCKFAPVIFHPNVFPEGFVCLSILQHDNGWRPSLTIKDVLIGVQTLMNEPNDHHIAQAEAQHLCRYNHSQYIERIKAQAKAMTPKD